MAGIPLKVDKIAKDVDSLWDRQREREGILQQLIKRNKVCYNTPMAYDIKFKKKTIEYYSKNGNARKTAIPTKPKNSPTKHLQNSQNKATLSATYFSTTTKNFQWD